MFPDCFVEELRAHWLLTAAEHALFGADVVEAFRDYLRVKAFVAARRPGLEQHDPSTFRRVCYWTMGITDGGKAARA